MSADPRPDPRGVTLIMTVLNEERYIADAIAAVLDQDWPHPLELIVALGPSGDNTDEIVEKLAVDDNRVRAVPNPTGRRPEGLNRALAVAAYDVVIRVDGHAELPPDYVSIAVETLDRTGAANVGGVMAAEGQTDFEEAVAIAMTSPLGVGAASFHTGGVEGPAETAYLGAFRRDALAAVGGYDEAFSGAEDWELNYRIRSTGALVWFNPAMRVRYRPRGSVSKLSKQYFAYGGWRRQVTRSHHGTVQIRYLAAPIAVSAMAVGAAAGLVGQVVPSLRLLKLGWLGPVGYAGAIAIGGLAIAGGSPVRVKVRVPVVLATMHCSWGLGFLVSRT